MTLLQRATLAAVRAMLGEITPAMRVVTIDAVPGRIVLRVYHEGPASEELQEDIDAATTEILAEFTDAADLPAVDFALEATLEKPVITSNQATFWAALRLAKIGASVTGYGQLFERAWPSV